MRSYSTSQRILRPPLADTSLVGAWTMEAHGGRLIDQTTGAHNGTPTTAMSTFRSLLGNAQYFPGSHYIDCGSLATDVKTLEFWIRPEAADDYIFDIKAGTHYVYLTAGAIDPFGWTAPTIYVDGVAGTNPVLGKWNHIVITTATAITADNFNFGIAAANYFNGSLTGICVYSAEKDAAWAAARFRLGADAIQFRTTWGAKETLAASEGPGMYVGFNSTPFRVEAGLARLRSEVIDAAPVKYIEGVFSEVDNVVAVPTSRFFATPTEAAFGTWEFETQKGAGEVIDIAIIATSAAVSGYSLRHAADDSLVLREVGVGNVVTGGTATSDARHRHKITRRFDGLFTCETDGVVWGTGTDLTTTTASHVVYGLGSATGNRVYYAGPRNEHGFIKRLGA